MFFKKKSAFNKKIIHFLVLLTMFFSTGCFHEFYKTQSSNLETFKNTVSSGDVQKYYVVHHRGSVMHLDQVAVKDGNLIGVLSELPLERVRHLQKDPELFTSSKSIKSRRYRPKEKNIVHHVHIYLGNEVPIMLEPGTFDLTLAAVQDVQIYSKEASGIAGSHILGVLGGAFLVFAGLVSLGVIGIPI